MDKELVVIALAQLLFPKSRFWFTKDYDCDDHWWFNISFTPGGTVEEDMKKLDILSRLQIETGTKISMTLSSHELDKEEDTKQNCWQCSHIIESGGQCDINYSGMGDGTSGKECPDFKKK